MKMFSEIHKVLGWHEVKAERPSRRTLGSDIRQTLGLGPGSILFPMYDLEQVTVCL